jgi:hypothetical protein
VEAGELVVRLRLSSHASELGCIREHNYQFCLEVVNWKNLS